MTKTKPFDLEPPDAFLDPPFHFENDIFKSLKLMKVLQETELIFNLLLCVATRVFQILKGLFRSALKLLKRSLFYLFCKHSN